VIPSGPAGQERRLQVSDELDRRADEIVRLREELEAACDEIEQLRTELEALRHLHREQFGGTAAEFDHMRTPPSTSRPLPRREA
jgi:predicted RNase H-like nuclease (RuvC/YqgF family)